jgi:RimJ/RimL family protein N-acetyltransferase
VVEVSKTMIEAASYEVAEALRDGRRVTIRALKPDDRAEMVAAVDRSSPQSLYRRFFAPKRDFSEKEIAFFVNVDFINHVALVALLEEGDRSVIVGGGRYVVVQPGRAEVAFTVVDQYQGQGVGTALLKHLVVIARDAGISELIADILQENIAMQNVLQRSGLSIIQKRDSGIVHIALQLPVRECD